MIALTVLLKLWEDNTKMNCNEIGWESVDWIDLAQGTGQW
jgi:hypothetical protein